MRVEQENEQEVRWVGISQESLVSIEKKRKAERTSYKEFKDRIHNTGLHSKKFM
jgi:hypothetical protein